VEEAIYYCLLADWRASGSFHITVFIHRQGSELRDCKEIRSMARASRIAIIYDIYQLLRLLQLLYTRTWFDLSNNPWVAHSLLQIVHIPYSDPVGFPRQYEIDHHTIINARTRSGVLSFNLLVKVIRSCTTNNQIDQRPADLVNRKYTNVWAFHVIIMGRNRCAMPYHACVLSLVCNN